MALQLLLLLLLSLAATARYFVAPRHYRNCYSGFATCCNLFLETSVRTCCKDFRKHFCFLPHLKSTATLPALPPLPTLHPTPSRPAPPRHGHALRAQSSDFDCSASQDQGGNGARPGAAARRDDSLFTPQELARIKKQFEKSLEGGEED